VSGFRLERLLPLACLAAAALLFASELLTTFDLTPQGHDALCSQSAIDRHHYAQAVLAACAMVATIVAIASGSKPAATAVAVLGVLALLLFLLIDLPKVNNVGTLSGDCTALGDFAADAKAVPQAGFWLELVGALALAISGAALASLSPQQLRDLRWRAAAGEQGRQPAAAGGGATGKALLADAERYGEEVAASGNSGGPRQGAREPEGTQPETPGP
jgi:hypothetical protein